MTHNNHYFKMSTDFELIQRIAEKDRQAFETLYQTYQPMVLRYCGRLLNHDVETAADITDDVFFDVWQKSNSFRGEAKVKTWLFSIAHNKAVSYIRKNREVSLDNEEQIHELIAEEAGQEQLLNAEQKNTLLAAAIDQLSLEHKEVLHLFYYSDMSIKAIATTLAINDRTVRTRLHYAKKSLVPLLAAVGIKAESFFDTS